jgi:hypothetical protein
MFYLGKVKLILINNTKTQIFTSFFNVLYFIRSISTGYVLTFFQDLKKNIKRKLFSFVLQLKVVINVINKCFPDNNIIFQIKGTKKNFFKWLNFLRVKTRLFNVFFYIYTPKINLTRGDIKKIRSIKRRMKKKYIYKEDLT